MPNDLKEVIMEKYLSWIKDNTFLKDLTDGTIKIVSPFLDAHNDYLRLYVKRRAENQLRISDGGLFALDLDSYGIELAGKRKEIFDSITHSYGVDFNVVNNEIYVDTDINGIGRAKHRIIQCLANLNDLFNYTTQNIQELFFHDVYNYLLESNVQFNPNIQLRGAGFEHRFDFAIGMSKNSPEKLIKLVAHPNNKQKAELCLFSFVDLQKTSRKFRGVVIYKGKANDRFLEAFNKYNYSAYSWEEKEEVIKVLAD